MYDGNGDEILTYTAGVGWYEKEAETEVQGALKAAYYDAYHAARQEINYKVKKHTAKPEVRDEEPADHEKIVMAVINTIKYSDNT